ncbi:MAG: tetratricopeptide repeat protein [Acidobacteriota bacterium]
MKNFPVTLLSLLIALFAWNVTECKCRGREEMKIADQLYFDKNWSEALDLYLKAQEKGCEDGITLYKISFCYMKAGDREKEKEFLNRAVKKLQQESSRKPTLDNLFYLANCYVNLNMREEWLDTSRKAIDLYEKGQLKKVKDSLSFFRIGKIYLDAGNNEKAAEHYRKAFELNKKNKLLPPEYIRRILVVIAEVDYKGKDFARASEEFEELVKIEPKYEDGYYRLAVSALNSGQYEKAESAWKKVIELHLPYSEEAQYNHRIARAALEESPLPETDESENKFKKMNDSELEAAIIELSRKGQDLKKTALDKKGDFQSIQNDLWKVRRTFIAACAEYIGRGILIRDLAITSGFAVQIMRKDAWEVPQKEESQ